jgi:phosphate:Na+ symporter
MTAITDLESIADIMESEMVAVSKTYLEGDYQLASDETRELLQGLWVSVRRALELAVRAVGENDQRLAREVLLMKDDIRDLADQLFARHAGRLRADDPKYLARVRLLMTYIEQLRHMYTLTKRIARTHVPATITQEAD